MQIKSGACCVDQYSTKIKGIWEAGLINCRFTATMSGLSGPLTADETLVGQTSGANLQYKSDNGSILVYWHLSGTPATSEVFEGQTSTETVTLTNHVITGFGVGNTVNLSPSNSTGKVTGWDATNQVLRWERTNAVDPAANDIITDATSSARGKATAPASTTKWKNGDSENDPVAVGGSYAPLFNRRGIAVSYEVSSVTEDDEMDLTTNYVGDTEDDVPYRISQDFDAETGLAMLNNGDVDVPSLWNRNITKIKTLLGNAIGLFSDPPTFTGNALKTSRVNSGETALELFLAFDATAGGQISGATTFYQGTSIITKFLKNTFSDTVGGRVELEAPTDDSGNNAIIGYDYVSSIAKIRFFVTGAKEMSWESVSGKLTVDQLDVTDRFVGDVEVGYGKELRGDYESMFDGEICTVSSTGYTTGEIVDFTTSNAIGEVYAEVGSVLVYHLVSGTPQSGESCVGRRSAKSATISGLGDIGTSAVTATRLTANNNPSWTTNEWSTAGCSIQITADTGNPAAVGNTVAITANGSNYVDVSSWGTGMQPSTSAVWRIVDPAEDREAAFIPYGLATPTLKDNNDQTSITTETVLTQLSITSAVPGANGSRWFKMEWVFQLLNQTASANAVDLKVYIGPLGTTSDPLFQEWQVDLAANDDLPIAVKTYDQLAPDDLITVTATATQNLTVRGGTTGTKTSSVDVIQVQRRT